MHMFCKQHTRKHVYDFEIFWSLRIYKYVQKFKFNLQSLNQKKFFHKLYFKYVFWKKTIFTNFNLHNNMCMLHEKIGKVQFYLHINMCILTAFMCSLHYIISKQILTKKISDQKICILYIFNFRLKSLYLAGNFFLVRKTFWSENLFSQEKNFVRKNFQSKNLW